MWSLLFEAIAYVAFAFGASKLRVAALAAIALISAGALVLMVGHDRLLAEFGTQWHTLGGGFARLGFIFTAGMLLYHLRRTKAAPTRRVTNLAWTWPLIVLAILASVPPLESEGGVTVLLLAFPLIGWLALC